MLLQILAHHQEAADPDLLDKIKDRLDAVVNLGPMGIVILLGLVVVAIPVGILFFYARQRRRSSAGS